MYNYNHVCTVDFEAFEKLKYFFSKIIFYEGSF